MGSVVSACFPRVLAPAQDIRVQSLRFAAPNHESHDGVNDDGVTRMVTPRQKSYAQPLTVRHEICDARQ